MPDGKVAMPAEQGRTPIAGVAAPAIDDERVAQVADDPVQPLGLSLAAHPRAARRVAESKAWGGLAGFLAGGYLSLAHHAPAEAALRALVAGVVCYVVVWAAAVFVWRRLVVAELRQHEAALGEELARRASGADAPGAAGRLGGGGGAGAVA